MPETAGKRIMISKRVVKEDLTSFSQQHIIAKLQQFVEL